MASEKITGLATGTPDGATDYLVFVDVSDTSLSPTGTNKKVTPNSLVIPSGSDTEIQYNNSGAFGASSALTFDGSKVLGIGTDDTVNGIVNVFGDSANTGGAVNLYTGATSDTNVNAYILQANGEDFKIVGDVDRLTFDYSANSWRIEGEFDLNGNSIGGDSQSATGDGTTTIDWKLGNTFDFQFGAFNEVFTFTAPTKPGTFILKLVQDSVGSRTATFPASVKWSGGGTAPTLTTTATTGTDIITFYWDGTSYFAVSSLDFS